MKGLDCLEVLDYDINSLSVKIQGPINTAFENSSFLIRVNLPSDFPLSQPKIFFKTPIFHPNIDYSFQTDEVFGTGEICLPIESMGIKVWSAKISIFMRIMQK